MKGIILINHAHTAPGLRLLGLGPNLAPINGLSKLRSFLNANAFWAKGRNTKQIKQMLLHSAVVISVWQKERLIGFGRATSDQVFRAVIWDVVVASDWQGHGMGKLILEASN